MEARMIRFFIIPVVLFLCQSPAFAETLTLAAGARYKRPLSEIIRVYETSGGNKIDQIYGYLGPVLTQARGVGNIAFIVGEEAFLKSTGIEFVSFHRIGDRALVIAYGKNIKLESSDDLLNPEVTKIAVPDEKHAIYGKAAKEFLQKTGLMERVRKKLLVVSSAPEICSYLVCRRVEAGFLNVTDARYIKNKIGGYLTPDASTYSPIKQVLGVVKGYEENTEAKKFLSFLEADPKVKEILKRDGL
jgi:molybdate transport system substrate-binding protein